VDNAQWKGKYSNPLGLARLVEAYRKLTLPKGRVQRSNWEENPLSELQQEYAANDAHAGLVVFNKLMTLMDPMEPPLVKHTPSAVDSLTKPVPSRHYYTFDYNGHLVETGTTGKFWNCYNPDYNPGPPPPPKVPKPPKAKDVRVMEDGEEGAVPRGHGIARGTGHLHDLAGRAKRRHAERDQSSPSSPVFEESGPESSYFRASAGPSSRGGLMQRISPRYPDANYGMQQQQQGYTGQPHEYWRARGNNRGRPYPADGRGRRNRREPRGGRGGGTGDSGDQRWTRPPVQTEGDLGT